MGRFRAGARRREREGPFALTDLVRSAGRFRVSWEETGRGREETMPEPPANEIQNWVALFIIGVVLLYWLLRVTVLLIGARLQRRDGEEEEEE